MSNTKIRWNIFLTVIAVFLAGAAFSGCGKESAETKNEASGGKVYVDYASEEDRILATDKSGAAERMAGIAALEKLNDHEKAMRHFRAGAEKGDRDAMMLYATGETDKAAVEEFLKKAAQKGDSNAMMLYALFLEKGYGTGKDEAATEEWLKKAAETGDPLAQFLYGSFLMEHRKKTEGLAYLRKSADAGCVHGQFAFGMACMDEGDYASGLANLKKAASQPLTDKKDVMDYADDQKSYKDWADFPFDLNDEHLTTANMTVIMSQVMLGMTYHAGVATGGRDLNEAKKWLKMARANGCTGVDEWLEELEKENR